MARTDNKHDTHPPMVRLQIGYTNFLIPASRAQAALELFDGAYACDVNYKNTDELADQQGYVVENLKRMTLTLNTVVIEQVIRALAMKRIEGNE